MDIKDLHDVSQLLQGYIDKHQKPTEEGSLVESIRRHFRTKQKKRAVPIADEFKENNLSSVIDSRRAVVNAAIDKKLAASKTAMIERLTEDFVYPPIGSLPITRIGSIHDDMLPLVFDNETSSIINTRVIPAVIHGRYYEIKTLHLNVSEYITNERKKYYIYIILKRGIPTLSISATLANDSYTRTYVGIVYFNRYEVEYLTAYTVSKVANHRLTRETRIESTFAELYAGAVVSEIINKIEVLPDTSSLVPIDVPEAIVSVASTTMISELITVYPRD